MKALSIISTFLQVLTISAPGPNKRVSSRFDEQGLTQEETAEETGVSQRMVSYILRKHHISSNPENLIISNSTKLCTSANFGKNYKIVENADQGGKSIDGQHNRSSDLGIQDCF